MYTESRSEEVLTKKQQHPLFSSRHEISMSRRSPWEFFSFEMQYWGLNQIERERREGQQAAGGWWLVNSLTIEMIEEHLSSSSCFHNL
jgi:hypothetical protein